MAKLLAHVEDIRDIDEAHRQFYEYNAAEERYELQIQIPIPRLKPRSQMSVQEKARAIGQIGQDAYFNLPE